MDAVFLKLLNMSITAGWLVLAVLGLRMLLKKAPKGIVCGLWALVGIRLIFPISIESVLSLIPSAETIPAEIVYAAKPTIESGIGMVNEMVNPVISASFAPNVGDSANPLQIVTALAAVLWLAGMGVFLLIGAVSYIRVRRKVGAAVELKYMNIDLSEGSCNQWKPESSQKELKNIFVSDEVKSPFILGVLRPHIYLPSDLTPEQMEYCVAHEKAHLKRRDHLWKPLGFVLLAVYWFNPLMWVAYIMLCKDIESACDERVVRKLGAQERKNYAEILLFCSAPRPLITACPLAFGEIGVKERVRGVLNYKKPGFWVVAVALVACIVTAVCFLTNPVTDVEQDKEAQEALMQELKLLGAYEQEELQKLLEVLTHTEVEVRQVEEQLEEVVNRKKNQARERVAQEQVQEVAQTLVSQTQKKSLADLDKAISAAILEKNMGEHSKDYFCCESHVILYTLGMGTTPVEGTEPVTEQVTAYIVALYQEYVVDENGIQDKGGSHGSLALTFELVDGEYILQEYWQPRDGSYYTADIQEKFPPVIAEQATDTQKYILENKQACYAKAVGYAGAEVDVMKVIDGLFETIESSPKSSSSPADYLEAHPLEYRELLYYGEYTMSYCVRQLAEELSASDNMSLRVHLILDIMEELSDQLRMFTPLEDGVRIENKL